MSFHQLFYILVMMLFLHLYKFLVVDVVASWLDIVPPESTFSSLSTFQIINAIFIAPVIFYTPFWS